LGGAGSPQVAAAATAVAVGAKHGGGGGSGGGGGGGGGDDDSGTAPLLGVGDGGDSFAAVAAEDRLRGTLPPLWAVPVGPRTLALAPATGRILAGFAMVLFSVAIAYDAWSAVYARATPAAAGLALAAAAIALWGAAWVLIVRRSAHRRTSGFYARYDADAARRRRTLTGGSARSRATTAEAHLQLPGAAAGGSPPQPPPPPAAVLRAAARSRSPSPAADFAYVALPAVGAPMATPRKSPDRSGDGGGGGGGGGDDATVELRSIASPRAAASAAAAASP